MGLTIEQWTQVGIAAGMLLTGLVTLVASLWLSKQAASQVAQLWLLVRARQSSILTQIDEPTDALPRLVERYTGIPAPVASALLTALTKTLLEHLDVPVREVRLDETPR